MAAKRIPTRGVDKRLYVNYLKKASEFYDAMTTSFAKEQWNASGLAAVHCALSANDALLVCYHGLRSASPKHDDAIKLLVSLVKHEDVEKNSKHLAWLINKKNLLEYEERLFTRREAETAVKKAERFFNWVKGMLP